MTNLTFKVISIENTAVKKTSKYLRICKTCNKMKFTFSKQRSINYFKMPEYRMHFVKCYHISHASKMVTGYKFVHTMYILNNYSRLCCSTEVSEI